MLEVTVAVFDSVVPEVDGSTVPVTVTVKVASTASVGRVHSSCDPVTVHPEVAVDGFSNPAGAHRRP